MYYLSVAMVVNVPQVVSISLYNHFYAVHGFSLSEYRTNESVLALVDDFQLFVKGGSLGVAPTLSGLPGSLTAESVTALGEFALEFFV